MIGAAATIHRAFLHLYPHAFRQSFQTDLEHDFEDGYRDAARDGSLRIAVFLMRTATDLLASLVREWLRTPWIPVWLAAGSLSIGLFAFAAFKIRQWPQYAAWPAWRDVESRSDSIQLIVLMTVGVLIPIAGTILGSLWMLLLRRSIDGRRRRRV